MNKSQSVNHNNKVSTVVVTIITDCNCFRIVTTTIFIFVISALKQHAQSSWQNLELAYFKCNWTKTTQQQLMWTKTAQQLYNNGWCGQKQP